MTRAAPTSCAPVVAAALLLAAAVCAPSACAHDHFPGDPAGQAAQDAALALAAQLAASSASSRGARGARTASGGCLVDGQWWDGADTLVSLATAGPIGPLQRVGEFANDTVPVEANCNGGEQPCAWTWAAGTADTAPPGGTAATISLTRSDGVAMAGVVSNNCSHITWQAPVGAAPWQNLNHQVERVHLVSMTHFDLGYTENSAEHLLDDFSQTWFPAAFNVSRTLRARGGPERFVWSSHPWLMWSYLNNETGHVTAAQVADLDAAVRAGDVIWHANPMNMQFEGAEPGHMAEQLELSSRLRARYNMTAPGSNVGTLAASNKDEPGATLGLVRLLAARGVKFLHIGINDFSTVPALPSSSAHFHGYCNTFVWRDEDSAAGAGCSNSSGGGGGGDDDDNDDTCELVVAVCSGYSKSFNLGHQVPAMEVLLPGMSDSLAFLMQVDNRGPPTVEQVLQGWADTQAKYPNAEIVTSSLDNFAALLAEKRQQDKRQQQQQQQQHDHRGWRLPQPRQQQQQQLRQRKLAGGDPAHAHAHAAWALPVVTNKEIGSTWIFGMASDATKLAWYRAAARARAAFLQGSPELKEDPSIQEFSRLLGKLPEHTAGSSGGGCNGAPWANGAAGNACEPDSPPWTTVRTSYLDQRNYVWKAVQALGDSADGWRVLPNGAIGCAAPTQCLVPPANDTHGCSVQYAAPSDPVPQCAWSDWVRAKENCGAWDECGGFWCDAGRCWARATAAMGPTGIPVPFVAPGFGGAVSWVKVPPADHNNVNSNSNNNDDNDDDDDDDDNKSVPTTPTPRQQLRQAVETELAATLPDAAMLTAAQLTAAGLHPWTASGAAVQVGVATVTFDPQTAAIVGLETNASARHRVAGSRGRGSGSASSGSSGSSRQWSSPDMPLGLLRHAAHDEAQCNLFRDEYNLRQCASACGGCGFSKCDLGGAATASYKLRPTVVAAWTDLPGDAAENAAHVVTAGSGGAATVEAARFWFNLTFGPSVRGEPPAAAALAVTVSATGQSQQRPRQQQQQQQQQQQKKKKSDKMQQQHDVDTGAQFSSVGAGAAVAVTVEFDLQWWGKKPTREAESLWFSISPLVGSADDPANDRGWLLDKLGRWVDPLSTVINGSRTVHHVWSGVRHLPNASAASDAWDVEVQTLDAGLVSPSTPTLSPTGSFNLGDDGVPHPGVGGLHFNLFNNAWSTNYALFSQDESNRFRWTLTVRHQG